MISNYTTLIHFVSHSSCEPCRKFISKAISKLGEDGVAGPLFECVAGSGTCVVPPVIRTGVTPVVDELKGKKSDEARCQACWLKLCLIGYNLEADLYDKLRLSLPSVFTSLLPPAGMVSNTVFSVSYSILSLFL